jgi:hypothetical protein
MREKIKMRDIETKSPNFPSIKLDNIDTPHTHYHHRRRP